MVNDFSCAAYSCLRNTDALPMKRTFPQSHKVIRMEEEKKQSAKIATFYERSEILSCDVRTHDFAYNCRLPHALTSRV